MVYNLCLKSPQFPKMNTLTTPLILSYFYEFKFLKDIYLKGRVREIEGETEIFHVLIHSPNEPGLDQPEASSHELHLGLLCGW